MKINIGCGQYPFPGYTNIDLVSPLADIQGDFRKMSFEDVEEVTMFHVLEHLPLRDSAPVMRHVHRWMRDGGTLTVEVPDMAAILRRGTRPGWEQWIYGCQDHEGEFHKSGFTLHSLRQLVAGTGYKVTDAQSFISEVPARTGFPCISVTATRLNVPSGSTIFG